MLFRSELISHGDGEIFTDGNMIKTESNRLFFRTPGMTVEGFTPYYSIYIVFDFNKNLYQPPELQTLPQYIDINDDEFIKGMFMNIYNAVSNVDQYSDLVIYSSMCQIFLYIIKSTSNDLEFSNATIKKALEYIHDNLSSKLGVNELAAMHGYSLNYFIKAFKHATGKTPVEYINDLRIAHSIILLNETNDSVESISEQCGFVNLSYFFRTFKKKNGVSPSQLRKLKRFPADY